MFCFSRKFLSLVLAFCLLVAVPAPAALALTLDPAYLVSDADFFDVESMTEDSIHKFLLEKGALGGMLFTDIDGTSKRAAAIIMRVARTYGLSPKFLLVMLQREQSLIEDPTLSENQLAWAMGYAVCDSCRKDDPGIQQYRGFAQQLESAGRRIRDSYLADLTLRGATLTGIGPGRTITINGQPLVPANLATSVLYTYTPHLLGNLNFSRIWQRWFTQRYPDGSLLQARGEPGVWLIERGVRRPITSRPALTSRYDIRQVLQVPKQEILAYEIGAALSFINYSLLQDENGQKYLVVDTVLRPMTDEAFRGIGFSTDELIPVQQADIAGYALGEPLTVDAASARGEVVRVKEDGALYQLLDGVAHAILSDEILRDKFSDVSVHTVSRTSLPGTLGAPVSFRNGTLVKARTAPDVFLIVNGVRRPIASEKIFHSYGFSFARVIATSAQALEAHPLGNPLPLLADSPQF